MIHRAARWVIQAELLWLALLTPLFYFPGEGRGLVILAIPVLWLLRKITRGHFLPATPINAALLLLLVMSGVGLAVSFDRAFSFEYVSRLLLGVSIFFALVDVGGKRSLQLSLLALLAAVTAMVAVGLLGTDFSTKIPQLDPLIQSLPSAVLPFLQGQDTFNPNIVGGITLFALPLLVLLVWPWANPLSVLAPERTRAGLYLTMAVTLLLVAGTLLISQSRGGYIGVLVGLVALVVLPRKKLGATLGMLVLIGGAALYSTNNLDVFDLLADSETRAVSTSVDSIEGRMAIWGRAFYALEDFPYTGVGVGLFREVVPILYPLFSFEPDKDIGHAHNQFLAAGTDYGLPGMIAWIALWLLMGVMLWRSWHSTLPLPYRRLALGLAATAVAHFTWSLTDAIVLGARGHLPFWMLLAAIVTLHRLAVGVGAEGAQVDGVSQPGRGVSEKG